ncbi:unnamed protein product [Paramecium pentaurelia]|uniref:Uncharacterized protein n=1 Tax=Paramecium pentaurelia TaxID=43138 RepID=A0A8S1Y1E9_9CILI|nr:unnamed protein product [Paramecium pentaurelia]
MNKNNYLLILHSDARLYLDQADEIFDSLINTFFTPINVILHGMQLFSIRRIMYMRINS